MSEVTRLIAKQVSLWEVRRRLEASEQRPGRKQLGGVSYGPYLLLSRQRGSGGDEVARLAAQRLGWQVFDREIVNAVAERAHVRQHLVSSLDEHARTTWEETLRSALMPENIAREEYFLWLRQVILSLGHHGDVVLIGRGAQFILPAECGLRVRVVAPAEWRAQKIATRFNLPLEEARREVQRADNDRAAFVRQYFRQDAADPANHDLVVNTAEVGIESAAEMVLMGLQRKLGVCCPA
jgi:cytidylate kinase